MSRNESASFPDGAGFLDEKYSPGNMKNMHAGGTNILAKHAS
jgi:hypothetical protein